MRTVWNAWKRVGRFIGNGVARVVLTVFHFTLFVSFAITAKLTTDPLGRKPEETDSYWLTVEPFDSTTESARRLF